MIMNPQKIGVRYGSLIKLKSEFEERYIILHRHTFPGVQQRLYDSHIRNFSIFLKDGTLFSYFEYVGDNYSEDMERIAQDAATQDWWKLTGPMQIPLENRENGEWWASMPEKRPAASKREDRLPLARCTRQAHSVKAASNPT